jgi:hypothetical protein
MDSAYGDGIPPMPITPPTFEWVWASPYDQFSFFLILAALVFLVIYLIWDQSDRLEEDYRSGRKKRPPPYDGSGPPPI